MPFRRAATSLRHTRQVTRRALLSVGGAWSDFADWFNGLGFSENAILLGFGVGIGAVAALGVVAFYRLIDVAFAIFWTWPIEHLPYAGFLAYRPLLTAAGFAVAWWVMRRFAPGNDGLNVPDVQAAVARRGGHIPVRPALVRTLAISRTPAAGFGAAQRQISYVTAAESYVIMATVGFADDRRKIHIAAVDYQNSELSSLAVGLVGKAKSVLGGPPAAPACPGTPGC